MAQQLSAAVRGVAATASRRLTGAVDRHPVTV